MALHVAVWLAILLPSVGYAQLSPQPGPLPPPPAAGECLHGPDETPAEAARRDEALQAMRVIYYVLERAVSARPRGAPFPSWGSLASSPFVDRLKNTPGTAGEMARTIDWGADEPLPGWGIAYVANVEVRFSLTDLRDPCAFTYSSTDPQVIPRRMRILPLGE